MSDRFTCLNEAAQAVQARQGAYGAPEDLFATIDVVYGALVEVTPDDVPEGVLSALFLAAVKLVRAASNPAHMDNWVDLAGYASLGYELAANADEPIL